MTTLADIEKKITDKIKILALAVKKKEINLSRGKESKLWKEKRLGDINNLKNLGQKIMLENDEINFEKVEEWGNKYIEAMAMYNIPMDEIESKLRYFKEMEKQNAKEQK